jgi:hypothetical protein
MTAEICSTTAQCATEWKKNFGSGDTGTGYEAVKDWNPNNGNHQIYYIASTTMVHLGRSWHL